MRAWNVPAKAPSFSTDRRSTAQPGKTLAHIRNQFVGFIFQSFQLLPSLTALENVIVPAESRVRNSCASRAVELLGRVGLGSRLYHYPVATFRRRAAARGDCAGFHESTENSFCRRAHRQPRCGNRQGIVRLIFELNADNRTTLVLVTHDADLTRQAGRVLSLKAGRLVGDRT